VEILDLKILCDLIELKSFTKAAEENYLTQSAVSQRINRLNESYGNKIFLNKKKLILSRQGKYLYTKFKDILKIYAHTEEIIERRDAAEVISIGVSENPKAKYFDRSFVDELLAKDTLLELYFGPSQSIYEKVLFGTLDYGIIGNKPQESTELAFEKLYAEKIVLATSAGNPIENVKILEIPIVLDHRDSGLYLFLKNELITLGIDIADLNIRGYLGTSVDKLLLLRAGDLYSFLPEWYASQTPDLKTVQLDFDLIRSFYEIYQKRRTGKIAFFRKLIRKHNGPQK
jgi:DNA-binding transcriptional LysR family regulator